MRDEVTVSVKDIVKDFSLDNDKTVSVKSGVVNAFKRGARSKNTYRALDGLSFDIKKGEFFGIVGRNGSGKSTLLKIIAGIYQPSQGSVSTEGKLVPFIELGVGFNPELTGRENVFLNGALLGFSRKEMEGIYDDIVAFAELERFMDQKLKNYSSGMQVRLAFSVAIKAQGDVLIFDEVLAVGDEAFQSKCDAYFDQVKKDKTKTVILVTHSMDSVKKYCDRAVLIKNGKVALSGSPSDVSSQYTEDNLSVVESNGQETGLSEDVPIFNIKPLGKRVVSSDESFGFQIEYDYRGADEGLCMAFSIDDIGRGGIVYDSGIVDAHPGHNKLSFNIPLNLFNSSDLKILATLRVKHDTDIEKSRIVGFTSDANSLVFSIRNDTTKEKYALLNKEVFKVEQL